MEARKSVHRLIHFMSSFNKEPHKATETEIANPCLSRGTTKAITLNEGDFVMTGADIGSFIGCTRIIELVMAKDA
jgi:guanosine-diphosphatase